MAISVILFSNTVFAFYIFLPTFIYSWLCDHQLFYDYKKRTVKRKKIPQLRFKMGFYSIKAADYFRSSRIKTRTRDPDGIISAHYIVAEIAFSACHFVVLFRSPLVFCRNAR